MPKNSFREQINDPRWQRKRLAILDRDEWMCQRCESTENQLQVHHLRYIKDRDYWDYSDDNFVTLCCYCHQEITELGNAIKGALHFEPINEVFARTLTMCESGKWFDLLCLLKLVMKNPSYMKTFLKKVKK